MITLSVNTLSGFHCIKIEKEEKKGERERECKRD
jgi:hypothetical protein